MTERGAMAERDLVRTLAMAVAAVFVLVGILGFIPGITTNYDDLGFAERDSEAELLGLFQVSILHNIVHLAFGLVGLALARTLDGARLFLIGGGLIYLVLWIYGLLIDRDSGANFIPINAADNWLHFILGVGMVLVGFVTTRNRARRPVTTP
jgi:amino acid permease